MAALVGPEWDAQAPAPTWLPRADALVQACVDSCAHPEPSGFIPLAEAAGAPWLDLVVTPMSARASLLGLATGRAFAHHELRVRPELPEALFPEIEVGGTQPVWTQGVLEEPKYFSFFQDAPIPVFNPGHRRKWRSHELLHGAAPFLWSPSMSRFECYLGARLHELLPVVHWYGLDEILRPRCPEHLGGGPLRGYCLYCEEAARPYWQCPDGWAQARRADGLSVASQALQHLSEEWDACSAELATGRRVERSRGYLNASSDAVGYLRGHWNRLTAWSFGAWVEGFLIAGVDYVETAGQALYGVAEAARRLLSGDIEVDPAQTQALRARRVLQDLGYRCRVVMEGLSGPRADRAEAALEPLLEEAGALSAELWRQARLPDERRHLLMRVAELVPRWVEAADKALPRSGVTAMGLMWPDLVTVTGFDRGESIRRAVPQLVDGLRDAAPLTAAAAGDSLVAVARDLAAAPEFQGLGSLVVRLGKHIGAGGGPPGLAAKARGLAEVEGWLAAEPRRDEEAEIFAVVPESVEELANPGVLRLHDTLRRRTMDEQVASALFGDPVAGEVVAVLLGAEPRLLPLNGDVAQVLDWIALGGDRSAWLPNASAEAVETLIEHGFVVWLPAPATL